MLGILSADPLVSLDGSSYHRILYILDLPLSYSDLPLQVVSGVTFFGSSRDVNVLTRLANLADQSAINREVNPRGCLHQIIMAHLHLQKKAQNRSPGKGQFVAPWIICQAY